jgi:hypothetical protein
MNKLIRAAALTALVATTGCYHYTVVTGAPPAEKTIDKKWQNSFILGLVPPPVINTQAECPRGVSQIETQHSFLNMLVSAITYNIYTPMSAKVTCASGPVRQQ